jgi:hypothetical protein
MFCLGLLSNGILVALAILIALLWLFGGLFLWKVSGKQFKVHQVFTKTWKAFFAWITPPWKRALKVFIVVALISAGLYLIMLSPRTTTYTVTTGYRYLLEEQPEMKYVPDYWCTMTQTPIGPTQQCGFASHPVTVYRYNLLGFQIQSTYAMWWLDPGLFLFGFTLIICGLLVAAWLFTRVVNEAYGVK